MKVLYQQGAIMMGEKGKHGVKSQKVLIGRRFGLNGLSYMKCSLKETWI